MARRPQNVMKPTWFGERETRRGGLLELNRVMLGSGIGAGKFSLYQLREAWETATGLPWIFVKALHSADKIVEDIDAVIGFLRPLLNIVEWNDDGPPLEEWASRYFMIERLEAGKMPLDHMWAMTTFALATSVPAKGFAVFADKDVKQAGVSVRYSAVEHNWRTEIWPVQICYVHGEDNRVARHEAETLAEIMTFLQEGQPFKKEAA